MSREEFILRIAPIIQKYAPAYGIIVCSPIIAQAILESDGGNSTLASYHNYFGLKWRENRCPTAIGYIEKTGSEQNPDHSYTSSLMKWMKFSTMENGVIGYFDFTKNYSGLKGVTNPRTYLENIKSNNYATSINYVDNLMNVITKYNLTRFDPKGVSNLKPLKIVLDAGHGINTAGKRCMKKLDSNQTREWVLNSRIAEKLEAKLKSYSCEVLRVDDPTGQKDISLTKRVNQANSWGADVYISIHHNAGIYGGSGGGTLVFYCSSKEERKTQAQALYDAIVDRTGLVGNRSYHVKKHSYTVIKKTTMPAFLFENGFMDSSTDVPIILTDSHATKTAEGVLNFLINSFNLQKLKVEESTPETTPETTPGTETASKLYRVQCGAFSSSKNAEALCRELKAKGYPAIIRYE